jgi:uncharacterized phage protein (TIGR01671 family)
MRPKFRVWDKLDKEIYEVGEIHWSRGEFDFIGDAITFKRDADEVELMQSTGLEDKNSKEIFEGDLIITNAYACIVCFGEYTYFEDEDTQTTAIGFYLSFLNVTPATYAPFEKCYWDNCEVIGNIHENELDLIMYESWKFNKELEDET